MRHEIRADFHRITDFQSVISKKRVMGIPFRPLLHGLQLSNGG